MAKKDGMYFYNNWLVPLEKLEYAEVGALVIAMMKYFVHGEEQPFFQVFAVWMQILFSPRSTGLWSTQDLPQKQKAFQKRNAGLQLLILKNLLELMKKSDEKKKEKISEKFEKFWEEYPNKSGKQQTKKLL